MTTFYICRHRQTEYNVLDRLQGQIDTPLTELGITNAQSAAQKLTGITVDHIYSSDLGRAMHTAFIVSKHLGCVEKIIFTKQLREISFGEYSGMKTDELYSKFPHFDCDPKFQPPSGESLLDAQTRVINFISELETKHPNETVLLFSHNVLINSIYAHYTKSDICDINQARENPNDFVAKFTTEANRILTFEEITKQ